MKLEAKQRLVQASPASQKVVTYLKRNGVGGPYMDLFNKVSNRLSDRDVQPFGLAIKLMNDGVDTEDALAQVHFGANETNLKDMIRKELNASTQDHLLLAMQSLTVDQWKAKVKQRFPKVRFVMEDGSGKTSGEKGDWTAMNGPDSQSDVVGTFSPSSHSCWFQSADDDFDEYDVIASDSNPLSDGTAFETLVDGAPPSQEKPLIQKLTNDDGSLEPADEQPLLIDDIPYQR